MKNCEYIDQRQLWDNQHMLRGGDTGIEATLLRYTPNDAAVILASALLSPSLIFEVGSANGRDARFLAALGHRVDCIDFSDVALTQLRRLAEDEEVAVRITTYCHDIAQGTLPELTDGIYDAFYARSALHVCDDALDLLATQVSIKLKPQGLVIIEGKSPRDSKILGSDCMGNGLVCDQEGHIRRVWDEKTMLDLIGKHGWTLIQITEQVDKGPYGCNSMMRLAAHI